LIKKGRSVAYQNFIGANLRVRPHERGQTHRSATASELGFSEESLVGDE
jgi:hypothetical protein